MIRALPAQAALDFCQHKSLDFERPEIRKASFAKSGVGKSTFDKDMNILRPRGYLVLFGAASGPVAPVDPGKLAQKGFLFLTRPTLAHHIATREELKQRAADVLGMIAAGKLKLRIENVYKLEQAQQAHRELEGRKTTGKLLLVP